MEKVTALMSKNDSLKEKYEDSTRPRNRLADLLYGGEGSLAGHPEGLLGEKGICVSAFAKRVGVSRQMFYRYLDGQSLPTVEVADRIAAELGITRKVFESFCGIYIPLLHNFFSIEQNRNRRRS